MPDANDAYYGQLAEGRNDYWAKMAAPRHRREVILRILRELVPVRLIDLGCGNGLLLRAVAGEWPEALLCGVDLSEAQIRANRETAPGVAWHAARLDAEDDPPSDLVAAFDCVIVSELIEHTERPDLLLGMAFQLATAGGHLVLSTQSGRIGETERSVGHLRHFDHFEIVGLLESSGWRVVRIWNTGFPFHDLSKWIANLRPAASLGRFGGERYGLLENAVCLGLRALFHLNSRTRGAQLFAVARKPVIPATGPEILSRPTRRDALPDQKVS